MDPKQTLLDAVRQLQRNEIDQCGHTLNDYWIWRANDGFEPVVGKRKVKGDEIARACRMLIDSQLYPY